MVTEAAETHHRPIATQKGCEPSNLFDLHRRIRRTNASGGECPDAGTVWIAEVVEELSTLPPVGRQLGAYDDELSTTLPHVGKNDDQHKRTYH
jgi:hypothetical protein